MKEERKRREENAQNKVKKYCFGLNMDYFLLFVLSIFYLLFPLSGDENREMLVFSS